MNCKILSWNVRGFSHPQRKFKVEDIILKWKPNVLFLQEVKLNNEHLDLNLFHLWKDDMFLHTLHSDGSSGVVLGLSPWISKHVIDKGEDPSHSRVWAFSFINGQPIGFCSIYAPNNPKDRSLLWDGWLNTSLMLIG